MDTDLKPIKITSYKMPKICYSSKNFSATSLDIIDKANVIIDDYLAQGFRLTLRQLFYQFVSRGLISNQQREYKRLGSIMNDARLAGMIDWDALEDRTRNLRSLSHWDSPSEIISACAQQFRVDKWKNQQYRPECWIEKDALIGVINGVCNELDVPHFSCRGYTSQSEMWAGAMRLRSWIDNGQTPVILHFGDHDPSGVDMTRDIRERLEMFMGGTTVDRLALNMNQIEDYNPPPNPAKLTDSRSNAYIAEFGNESWELDALEPQVMVDLIRDYIENLRDNGAWGEAEEEEQEARHKIQEVANRGRR